MNDATNNSLQASIKNNNNEHVARNIAFCLSMNQQVTPDLSLVYYVWINKYVALDIVFQYSQQLFLGELFPREEILLNL